MKTLNLKILTPSRHVFSGKAISITLPTQEGEITILPKHAPLFSLLTEGVVVVKKENGEEEYYGVGGGYLETDGKEAIVLVSRAFGQREVDEESIKKAIDEAEKVLQKARDINERKQAESLLRRSTLDLKLLQKLRRRRRS